MTCKEIISCADGGPTPPPHMAVAANAYYVGIYDDNGTILCEFFDNETTAQDAFDRIKLSEEEHEAGCPAIDGFGCRCGEEPDQ